MNANKELIERFYESFQKHDPEGMVSLYADGVFFNDPVFGDLKGDRAKEMWRMLAARAKDLRIEFSGIDADEKTGRAHWEAYYTFSATGRSVHNIIDAAFVFEDGKIREHRDTFDLWRWSGMALGMKGKLLGWTPFVQNAIRSNAQKGLDAWMQKTGKKTAKIEDAGSRVSADADT